KFSLRFNGFQFLPAAPRDMDATWISGRRSERDSDRSGAVRLLIRTHQDPTKEQSVLLLFSCELRSPSCVSDWTAHPFALFALPGLQPALCAVRPQLLVRMASV